MPENTFPPDSLDDLGEAIREGRPLRPAAGYRMRLAEASLDFAPRVIADPVPTGRQILALAGVRDPETCGLYAILDSGDFEDVRPEETFDLRAKGVERLIYFPTDRAYRVTLNEAQIAWGLPTISEHVLRGLAGAGDDERVFLAARGGKNRLIETGEAVSLEDPGVERFFTAKHPKLHIFFVNGVKYETDRPALTGLQIKARVPDWDQSHDLVLEGQGHDPDRVIRDDELVQLDVKTGPRRFSSVPKANFG